MNTLPRLMIAAPASGSGKSVIASGLMSAFSRRFPVQGFKVGPDYIDPMYHTAATGRSSRNLDTWMLSEDAVQGIFTRASQGVALSIVEGVMGLFDGYGSDPFGGSSAGVACLLKIPVILVIDCSKMSGSAAAVVHGFHTFSSSFHLAGVICNRVGSQQHGQWLVEAIEKQNNIPVLGCIPRLPALQIPERHLGLFTVAERQEAVAEFLQHAGRLLADHLDLERLLAIANRAEPLPGCCAVEPYLPPPAVRLAVARDEAFCFYYEDNLDQLRQAGAEIVPFSPLEDKRLPPGVSGLYLGGGYPELYAGQLSSNRSMLNEIRSAHESKMPVYAECGGLMYLTGGIHLPEGDFPLAELIPGWCHMGQRLNMGYREVETLQPGLFGQAGMKLRGHEFHYSEWQNDARGRAAYRISSRSSAGDPRTDGYLRENLQASYVHLHFGQDTRLASHFVETCKRWQRGASQQ